MIRPEYPRHLIAVGKYAKLGEFTYTDGVDYEGLYHVLPNGEAYSGDIPSDYSKKLFIKSYGISESVLKYNRNKGIEISKFIDPEYYYPIVMLEDRLAGKIYRYFVQKRSNPVNTITEIDYTQYSSINYTNFPGINSTIWNSLVVEWIIGSDISDIALQSNRNSVLRAEKTFKGISQYLTNYLEFYQ